MMGKIAILSDVHGNLPALREVLSFLRQKQVKFVWFLGDAIGYGPWPLEVARICASFNVRLAGNHELLATRRQDGAIYSATGRALSDWTRKVLDRQMLGLVKRLLPQTVLSPQPTKICTTRRFASPAVHLFHGSPLGPGEEYLVPGKVPNDRLLQNFGAMKAPLGFFGHTHIPAYFYLQVSGEVEFGNLQQGNPIVFNPWDGVLRMFNPGSVGQPRDGDPRASFAILEIKGSPTARDSRWILNLVRRKYDPQLVVDRLTELGMPEAAQQSRRLFTGY